MKKLLTLLILLPLRAVAQCAMCTSTVDLAVDKKHQVAHGFNHSIAFMLGTMTLLVAGLGTYIAWRMKRASRHEAAQGNES